ncbi:efflux RND transporter permease subunit [Salipaludibacillus sp. CUR1]|uniref:efflux RND transporter permease subunit n=1 Tax=Salipaludibacillus sp. CUR1 TaxID=2820003 RepID=UPI001E2C4BC0|nr:efflux RND transporter permease subunit [Salipaludibacillus sp. CUR1]MCE7792895.1 efflux RND transporter permease subunit [Salipaludibacillus sp. CUR1]
MMIVRKLLERKIFIGLMVVLILVSGGLAINKLDKELMPSVDFNMAMVTIQAGDLPVTDVETQITIPVEQALSNTDGVESYQSSSTTGSSSLFLEIEEGKMDQVIRDLETDLSRIENELSAVEFTEVFPMSTDQNYEFYMEISGADLDKLTAFGRDVEERLEKLDEVRDVRLNGLQQSEYVIEFDSEKLIEHGLDITQAAGMLQQADMNVSIGELKEEENEPSLRWNSAVTSKEDIEAVPLQTVNGPVPVDDIAEVKLEQSQQSSMAWKDGSRDFIFVEIGRANNFTQIELAEAVRAEVTAIKESGADAGLSFTEVVAQADYVSSSIEGVALNILIGGLLALVILLSFLKNFRATLIVGITIPVSILLTFTVMWTAGYSINMLTLIGLGLGIGMMVDASIVILESIYRKKEQGYEGTEAVMQGLKEVTSAVIASMLTTLVVFLPVGLFGGDFAVFILILSVVVVITLVSSVVIAFTLIPALAENFLKLREKDRHKLNQRKPVTEGYGRMIHWLSGKKRRRYSLIILFFIVFVSSMALTTKVPFTLMPDVLNRYAEVGVELESGLTQSEREEVVQAAQFKLTGVPDVESVIFMDSVDYLFALINMTKGDRITTDQQEVNEAINDALRELEPDYPVKSVGMFAGPGNGEPVQLYVKGEELTETALISGNLQEELAQVDGLVNLKTSADSQVEERQFMFKEEALEEDGLTKTDLYQQLQGVFSKIPVGEVLEDGMSVPILAASNTVIESEEALETFEITSASGVNPLSDYMELETVSSPLQIQRDNGDRYVTVTAEIEGRDLGAVTRDVQSIVDEFQTPSGYSVAVAGDMEAQQEMIMDLLIVLSLSLLLVYMVMAVQFNSLVHPLIIMSVIPMTAAGSVLALLITQRELSVLSALGILLLIGIVLNNAILLIDRIKQLRLAGMPVNEAVAEAGKNRIRPIFMTTLTTVGGMLPLAVAGGTASGYQAPLATVIIGGLLFATLITLGLIPSVYLMVEDLKRGIRKLFSKKKHTTPELNEKAS